MNINLKIKRYEKREGKGKDCLAIYNIIFDGKTTEGKDPSLKGLRLFESDKSENKKYIRMPQNRMFNGGYFNVFTLPEELFRQLEGEIIDHYERNYREQPDQIGDEIDLSNIKF